ncbi:hypothetical protein GCM10028819_33770 [Spirosoma humi]
MFLDFDCQNRKKQGRLLRKAKLKGSPDYKLNQKMVAGLTGVCDKVMQYTTKKIWQKSLLPEFNSKRS